MKSQDFYQDNLGSGVLTLERVRAWIEDRAPGWAPGNDGLLDFALICRTVILAHLDGRVDDLNGILKYLSTIRL